MRRSLSSALLLLLGLAACRAPQQAPTSASALLDPPRPYVRLLTADSNRVELQIAARRFVPVRGRGPIVWLTGVSHVGESNYYALLQQHLDAQLLVLYEGVSSAPAPQPASSANAGSAVPAPNSSAASAGSRSSLQTSLAAALGLAYQLQAIDYRRPGLRNSDLSVEEIRQLIADRRAAGAPGAAESFESLLQMMAGGSGLDSVLQVGLRFLGASPKLRALGKLALIETIGQIKGDPGQLGGLPPALKELLEVLIQKRNEKVIDDLRLALKEADRRDSIAIFYGTAHMPDLEQRLRELKYRPVEDWWLTALSVDLKQAGVSQGEAQVIRNFIKHQLEAAQTREAEKKRSLNEAAPNPYE